jgi:hypothetical protein
VGVILAIAARTSAIALDALVPTSRFSDRF